MKKVLVVFGLILILIYTSIEFSHSQEKIVDLEDLEGWLPTPPWDGPPLPSFLNTTWIWKACPVAVQVPGPTQYVDVPGPTQYIEVLGPVQYVNVPVDVPGPTQYTYKDLQNFSSLIDLQAWVKSHFTILLISGTPFNDFGTLGNCVMYAERYQKLAAEEGYYLSLTLVYDGMDYNQIVRPDLYGIYPVSGHMGNTAIVGNSKIYYVDPTLNPGNTDINKIVVFVADIPSYDVPQE